MRLVLVTFLIFGLACSGASTPDEPMVPPKDEMTVVTPTPTPEAAPKPKLDPGDPALADHWLVILGSKRDPAEVIPGVATIGEHPEVTAHVGTLLSSRYKNLMPCFTVTFAEATTEKDAAVALSKQLKDLGVDNYVKNTGAYVGPSDPIDAFCAGKATGGAGPVTVLDRVGEAWWMPIDAPESVVEGFSKGTPVALNEGYDAWKTASSATSVGAVELGMRYRAVDATTGKAVTCGIAEFAALTLGTPHFGVLQAETPPDAPACGDPAVFARLDCDLEDGTWVVAPLSAPSVVGYPPAGAEPGADVQAAAEAAADKIPEFHTGTVDEDGEPNEKTTRVTRYHGPSGDLYLVDAEVDDGDDVCGGTETHWYAVFAAAGDGLGAVVFPFHQEMFANVPGLVDVEGDGVPELVIRTFPEDTKVLAADGSTRGELAVAYCDCPC